MGSKAVGLHPILGRWHLEKGVLLLDAGSGAELRRHGVPTPIPLWSAAAILHHPDVVRSIHCSNARAGADVITALTFRTHRRALDRAGLLGCGAQLTDRAIRLAREGILRSERTGPVIVAGSLSPLEDCYRPDLAPPDEEARIEHRERASHLAASGADIVLAETFCTLSEARIALECAREVGLPAMVSLTVDERALIPSGESWAEVAAVLVEAGALAICVNCCPTPRVAGALGSLLGAVQGAVPVGAYANVGSPHPTQGWDVNSAMSPEAYGSHAREWIRAGARLVGGCCGTRAEHVAQIRRLLDGNMQ